MALLMSKRKLEYERIFLPWSQKSGFWSKTLRFPETDSKIAHLIYKVFPK